MSDPTNGFELVGTVTEEEANAALYKSAYAYGNGKYLFYVDGVDRYGTEPFSIDAGSLTPIGLPPSHPSGYPSLGISWLRDRWFGLFYKPVTFDGVEHTFINTALYHSTDLISWTEWDLDISDLSSTGEPYEYLPNVAVSFHRGSGLFWMITTKEGASEFSEANSPIGASDWLYDIAYASDPDGPWTVVEDALAYLPSQTAPYLRFLAQPTGQISQGFLRTNGSRVYFTYLVEHDEEPTQYGTAFKWDIILATAASPAGPWTRTVLQQVQYEDAPGAILRTVVDSVLPAPYDDDAWITNTTLPLIGQGGQWVVWVSGGSPWRTSNQQADGGWVAITEIEDSWYLDVSDDHIVIGGESPAGEVGLFAGDTPSSLALVDLDVPRPLDHTEARYLGDNEWLGYCYPADEDFWPDYWLTPAEGGDGWGIVL